MQRENLAVPVKLWALGCTIIGISLTDDTIPVSYTHLDVYKRQSGHGN